MILVKIYWNTHPDGSHVNYEEVDWDSVHAPVSFYGPFDSITDAVSWMENDYPEGDTDVHDMVADDFDLPRGWVINSPDSVHGDIPDEDIRDDSQEIHGT